MQSILIVLEAGNVYPSGFVRGLIYREHFLRHGFKVKYISRLFTPLIRLLNKPPLILVPLFALGLGGLVSLLEKPISYIKELYIVHIAKRYDVVYMSKVISFRLIKMLRQKTKARLVLDFGDALWLPRRGITRFNDILSIVDAVTTDNEYTATYVKKFNNNCTVVPDLPQVEFFDKKRSEVNKHRDDNIITLGWIGTPSTAFNLYLIWEPLERLFSKHSNLHLRLVGVGFNRHLLPPFEKVQFSILPYYSQSEMIQEVLAMDIGLFPLHDVEAARARGVLKATVYMSGEVAVVCSPIGQCIDLIQDGVNGMIAHSSEEWEQELEKLITDKDLRRQIAKAGLETVRRDFSLEKGFSKLRTVLEE